ncbi:serendipity locus protein alpha-like [Chironomus tepperi]|uniref:serendipity locus protein alpha-like n=1 Tax=Chironomus tepperi TaxID=113505 RepID=UPI00391F8106
MAEIVLNDLQNIQKYVYGEYKSAGGSNIEWLSQLSLKFIETFKKLHEFLNKGLNKSPNKQIIIHHCMLCANQIVVCLRFLEKTVSTEKDQNTCLITSRQCFFDRIFWCLVRLKSIINSANDHVVSEQINDQANFIEILDAVLDNLASFVNLDDECNVTNKAERRANMIMESKEIFEGINNLLSLTLSFSNVAVSSDQIPLKVLSENLFKISREFKDEFAFSNTKLNDINAVKKRLKSVELESSLYRLENYVNDSLLRLVYHVFSEINENPVKKLFASADLSSQGNEVDKFDILIERFLLIGQFAVTFAKDDVKVSSLIKSCLASIESLDTYLIPAITSKIEDPSIDILIEHFYEECNELQRNVHLIIDTKAFCMILVDLIIDSIENNRKTFDKASLFVILGFSKVLLSHLTIASDNIKLSQDKVATFYFNDFKLIINECEAILTYPDPIENFETRVLKRYNIMKNTIKKLVSAIRVRETDFNDENFKPVVKITEAPPKNSDFFNTIRPSGCKSVLYESKRSIKHSKTPTIPQPSSLKKSAKKRNESLRREIFKKNEFMIAESLNKNDDDTLNNTDLHITEILDKLSSLSIHIPKKY